MTGHDLIVAHRKAGHGLKNQTVYIDADGLPINREWREYGEHASVSIDPNDYPETLDFRFAKGLLRDANKNATVGTLWTGSLLRDYAAGSVVTLATEGVKSWDGTAFISRIRHDYVKTRSKLYLRKPLEGY